MSLLIFIHSDGQLICIYEPFWQEVSAVSDTQVTVKAYGQYGPVVFNFYINVRIICTKTTV